MCRYLATSVSSARGVPRSGCRTSTVPAAACASPRSLCCFLAAWHRLPGPPMETSHTPLPIGCQCLSPDQIAASQSRAELKARSRWRRLNVDHFSLKKKKIRLKFESWELPRNFSDKQTAPAQLPLQHSPVFPLSPCRFARTQTHFSLLSLVNLCPWWLCFDEPPERLQHRLLALL